MIKLTLTNKDGKILDLLSVDKYMLYKAEALHGIDADISTTESPYMDGANVANVKALPREIQLTFKLLGDVKKSLDYFTSIVKSKQRVTLIEIEDGREIKLTGIATIPPYTRMLSFCEIVLTIYCGQPYWEDINAVVGAIASTIDLLNFPAPDGQYFTPVGRPFGVIDTSLIKAFENTGDVAVGMNISIIALGTVSNPRISCSTGEQNGFYMELSGVTLEQNDIVIINTVKGNKYITINGSSDYNGHPILDYLTFFGTDWLQLETGYNQFDVIASEGQDHVYFTIKYARRYE